MTPRTRIYTSPLAAQLASRVLLGMAAFLPLVPGCASGPDTPAAPDDLASTPSAPAREAPPAFALDAERILDRALGEGASVFIQQPQSLLAAQAAPGHSGRQRTITWERAEADATELVRRVIVDGAVLRQDRLTLTPDGHIALSEQVDRVERVEVTFTPPLVIAPASLSPGAPPFEQTVTMVVHPLGDRRSIKAQGTATVRIEIEPAGRWVRPHGAAGSEVPTSTLLSTLNADLGASKVLNISAESFDSDGRLIATTRSEQTKALGLTIRQNRESWLRSQ